VLRGSGIDSTGEPEECVVPSPPRSTEKVLRPVVGEVPPELRALRMR
jgi:hypothetical protein